ncbi:class I adenylate-forming enzyme family protein [Amycolatopsis jejuensis]|uniref:class I adenylate-forming enzyme family protein n=1 Tax=Amycolatopsis jejuensis TaxID=330084 RepID=UPI000527C68D|nr:class I adenylate-forming enzyme family protein [Amycolatopsis jejuensis]
MYESPYQATQERTIPAMVESFEQVAGPQPIVIAEDGSGDAGEFLRAARSVAARFRQLGLEPGERVGLLVANGWRWMATAVGAHLAGLTVVCLNTWYREDELRTAVERTGVRLLISQRTLWGISWEDILRRAGLLEADLGTAFWERDGVLELPLDGPGDDPASSAKPEDIAFMAFTSGSSAEPKVVTLTHRDLMDNCYQIGRRQDLRTGDRLWMATPLFFGLGCANGIPVALTNGATLCIQERFEPWESAAFVEKHRCTVYYGLGPMTRALLDSGAAAAHDLSSLRTGITAFSPEEKRLAVEELGVTGVCSVYGLTEGYGHSTMTRADDDLATKLHTQGTVLPTQEIRIVDPESGKPAGPDSAAGEIQLRGCVTQGYFNDPESNLRSFTADGWFRTGDMGRIDEQGRLIYSGRLKEIVKVNGITVSPAEVEAVLGDSPVVEDVHAFGWILPGRDDETLCCAVVPRRGQEPGRLETELRAWLRSRVASYKIPGAFVFLAADQLPMTDSGKVNKRLIGETYFAGSAQ